MPSVTSDSKGQQLQSLFDEEWQYEMRISPETATQLGDNRYNDRLSDYSAEAAHADIEQRKKFLARFEAINPAGLSQQDTLSRQLMIRELNMDIQGAQF